MLSRSCTFRRSRIRTLHALDEIGASEMIHGRQKQNCDRFPSRSSSGSVKSLEEPVGQSLQYEDEKLVLSQVHKFFQSNKNQCKLRQCDSLTTDRLILFEQNARKTVLYRLYCAVIIIEIHCNCIEINAITLKCKACICMLQTRKIYLRNNGLIITASQ